MITNQMHADQAEDKYDSLAAWRVIWNVRADAARPRERPPLAGFLIKNVALDTTTIK